MESKAEYNPATGKTEIETNGHRDGISNEKPILGEVEESYNPSTGKYELIDRTGKCVGYVPKKWRNI